MKIRRPREGMVKISPSVLACDLSRLGEEVILMEKAGADMIHLDVMDGHFVPNITFGPPVIAGLRQKTGMYLDTHLMLTNPYDFIDDFAAAGCDMITFHVESRSGIRATIDKIKSRGMHAGLVLKPQTSPEAVLPFLSCIEMVLVMTVEPGFGGQCFMREMLPKISFLRQTANRLGFPLDIEVDGGIDTATAPIAIQHGANVLVAGSSLFRAPDYAVAVRELAGRE